MADIMRWPEVPGFGSLQREMDRLFEDFFRRSGLPARWGPAVDVLETADSVIVKVELPGVDPKSVDIAVSGENLTIKGEKKEEKEEKGKTFHRIERHYGHFRRVIPLPSTVSEEEISAEYIEGVLKVTLPLTEAAKPKHITVKS